MTEYKRAPDFGGDKQFQEIFDQFFSQGGPGFGGAPAGGGPDQTPDKDAERKAFERKFEEMDGGRKKRAPGRWRGIVALLALSGLAAVAFGVASLSDKKKPRMPARPELTAAQCAARAAQLEAQAQTEQRRVRAAQAAAQARQQAEEAQRRINEMHQRMQGTDISVAGETNGTNLIIPLLSGWKNATRPEPSADGFHPIMAFSPSGKEGQAGILYMASAPPVEEDAAPVGDGDPLAAARARFADRDVIESGKEVLTVLIAGTGEAGDMRHLHSFLLVNGQLVRLSALNMPLSSGMLENVLGSMRRWRAAFVRVNPASKG